MRGIASWGVIWGVVGICIVVILGVFLSIDQEQTRKDINLINPSQHVLEGRVKTMTITTETKYTFPLQNKEEKTRSLVVVLCSGEEWVVPQPQIDAVEKWLKSGLAPNKGCDK